MLRGLTKRDQKSHESRAEILRVVRRIIFVAEVPRNKVESRAHGSPAQR